MIRCIVTSLCCLSFLLLYGQAPSQPIIFDNDGSELLLNTYWNETPLTPAQLDSLVAMQKDSQVGIYALCAGSDFFYYPSRYGRLFGDDMGGTIPPGGNKALYDNMQRCYHNALRVAQGKDDFIAVTLKRARQHGMRTMLTFRLNDLHFTDTEIDCPVAYNEWWLAHPEYHIGNNAQGWHTKGAYDFAHAAVRERKLAVVEEQLQRYGDIIDYYLVDFMRFFCYFQQGEGWQHHEEMTQLVRDMRKAVEKASRKKGKSIVFAVRVAPSLAENKEKGLDVKGWLQEGLIDLLSVGIHIRLDGNMPIRQLREELGDALRVPLYAATDRVTYRENEVVSEGMMRGFCSHVLAQGADGIYLFNYFLNDYNRGRYRVEEGGMTCRVPHPRMLQELGNLATLEGRNKVYWLADGRREYGLRPNTPLPLKVAPGAKAKVTLFVGDHPAQHSPQEVILFVRTKGKGKMQVWLNGKAMCGEQPPYVARYDRGIGLQADEQECAFLLPPKALQHGNNEVQFAVDDAVVVKRVEMALHYGEVAQYGYF